VEPELVAEAWEDADDRAAQAHIDALPAARARRRDLGVPGSGSARRVDPLEDANGVAELLCARGPGLSFDPKHAEPGGGGHGRVPLI
jgi:hypothetical protein